MTEATIMPRPLKNVRILLWFQAISNILAGFLVIMLALNALDHGDEDGALPLVIGIISLIIAVVLAVCAVMISGHAPWVRTTIMTLEGITLVAGVIGLVSGGAVTLLIGIGIAIGILFSLSNPAVKEWFIP
ncbi:hypothetical protein SAMN05421504_105405 [Amycolatopsis xylanica]|uniref:Uncharacterized protein n=1 Tax=Amycolatopsis xylanica TaxID=589385 RepID=A0A1H3JIE3_9PSEU|nr:hypothetical protein [Amycolatopsis xylanica]SDY39178.1 hypothetical protein SAMN05421504_105405 [Amycolatopsis xylanica]